MREIMLYSLFSTISKLRRVEMGLVESESESDSVEKVSEAIRTLSLFRDRLIAEELTDSSDRLDGAVEQLKKVSVDLRAYRDAGDDAESMLAEILSSLPKAISLLNAVIDSEGMPQQ